ncbi:MAG: hypothetical protein MR224_05285 [Dorea sp.]|nr:hypothetical protein [Dorea sp.]
MAEFKLLDTVTLTPSEHKKQIDLSTYRCTEFLIHGNIPKTSNTTLFRIGIGEMAPFTPRNNSDVYAVEMIAHVHIADGIAMGFAGYESGWSGGNAIGAIMNTPRSTAPGAYMQMSFYPYVEGDEQAVIEIYGR